MPWLMETISPRVSPGLGFARPTLTPREPMRELVPDHEQQWFDIYGRVATTGVSTRFELEAQAMGRWYDVHAYRVGDPVRTATAKAETAKAEAAKAETAKAEAAKAAALAKAPASAPPPKARASGPKSDAEVNAEDEQKKKDGRKP